MSAALAIEALSHRYGERLALDQVSLTVEAGQCCILLGPNGAGKSTLFGLLSRLLAVKSGRITVFGQPLQAAALSRVGVVFQQSTLDLDLSVEQNLSYFGALHGMHGKALAQRIGEELERLDLAARRRDRVRDLNGGHRRRVEIARALLHRPALLLLDEPTVGLDLPSRQFLIGHLHRLVRDEGLALLWATHLIDEIDAQHDHVALLHRGRLLASGAVAPLLGASGCDNLASWFDLRTGAVS
ncbi:ABC transporter, ATP-binding protein [Pseudogulbenkiania sp. NH8B]|uniref:ATP-binding cassette domain-containing protein n=1 Tax=Pseudogulbenkiania sp. (strain NH8B) TaxID=748280 RepID=UPI000227A49F|nr:ATP-binding cassette domain-containing protein [Pseudogulbenkiania sp. NH8B]BAK78201.1 ABC transporter, ATP-binding protein [Pseudogulbenkiania sp. NH8B]